MAVVEGVGFDTNSKRATDGIARLRKQAHIVERTAGREIGELEHGQRSDAHHLEAGSNDETEP